MVCRGEEGREGSKVQQDPKDRLVGLEKVEKLVYEDSLVLMADQEELETKAQMVVQEDPVR